MLCPGRSVGILNSVFFPPHPDSRVIRLGIFIIVIAVRDPRAPCNRDIGEGRGRGSHLWGRECG